MNATAHEAIQKKPLGITYPTSYDEILYKDTVYCVTNVYKGEFKLKDALEDLVVRRALREALADFGSI